MGGLSRAFALVAASVGLALFGAGARAQEAGVADFYRGKTVSLIVSTTAGSSYDLMSRAIARFIGKYIPGSPGVVVRNQPGAGGITALSSLYHVAPRDGLTLAGVQGSVPFEPMLGTKEADFDAARLNWLGSPSSETCVTTVWAGSGVQSIKDARTREITMGSSGANANPSFYARLINAVLGVKLRLVFGYPGQPDVFIAMEKGEVDGHSCVFWSALSSTRPDWLRDGKVRLLLQYGPRREPALGDTPFLADLVTNPEDRILVAAAQAPLALGRPYVMPPETPRERVAAMRKALAGVFNDAEFLAETKRLGLDVNARQTGEDMQDLIARTYATPAPILKRLRALSSQ